MPNSSLPAFRLTLLFIFLSVCGLIGYALYSQSVEGLDPCPLCITQRVFYMLAGGVALIGVLHNPAQVGQRIYAGLIALASLGGAGVAGRQVWLQHLPADQVPACGPSLGYMLEAFPFQETIKMLFRGDGNCAEVTWRFLGMSMAEWSLIWFGAFVAIGIGLFLRSRRA